MGSVASSLWHAKGLSIADKVFNYIFSFSFVWPAAGIPATPGAFEKTREKFEKLFASGFEKRMEGWVTTPVEVARADDSTLQILLCRPGSHDPPATGAGRLPLVLWMHGGGYTLGTEKDFPGAGIWTSLLKEHGVAAVFASIAYRYAPEHPAPAAADDCELAARFLLNNKDLAQLHGYDCSKLHVWGQSAGGGLALVLAASLCRAGEASKVASVFADSPMCHPPCDTKSFARNAKVAWLAPAAWLKWAWKAYLGVETATELAAAMQDPKVCPHTAPGGIDGVRGVQVGIATSKADLLHDEGVQAAQAWDAAGAVVTHVDSLASHCMASVFDKPQWAIVLTKLAELLQPQ